MSFFKYIKKAFLYHWNLLFVSAGAAAAVISGYPDICLPLLGAAEILYLAILSANSRFQTFVNAEALQNSPENDRTLSSEKVEQILQSLSKTDREHFEELKTMCLRLRSIAKSVKGDAARPASLSEGQVDGINRLLWIYVKMLYSKNALELFFKTIDVREIREHIKKAKERLKSMGPEKEDNPAEAKRRNSIKDTLSTLEQRLYNFSNVKENYDFIKLELERLYSKITGIAEMGIHQQDSDILAGEIDLVSTSVQHTEKTMRDLESVTGFSIQEESVPFLLNSPDESLNRRIYAAQKS